MAMSRAALDVASVTRRVLAKISRVQLHLLPCPFPGVDNIPPPNSPLVHFRTCTRTTVGGPCWSAFGQGGWVPCINRSFPANSRPSSVSRSHMPATRSHHPLAPRGQKVRQQSRCPRRAGSDCTNRQGIVDLPRPSFADVPDVSGHQLVTFVSSSKSNLPGSLGSRK